MIDYRFRSIDWLEGIQFDTESTMSNAELVKRIEQATARCAPGKRALRKPAIETLKRIWNIE